LTREPADGLPLSRTGDEPQKLAPRARPEGRLEARELDMTITIHRQIDLLSESICTVGFGRNTKEIRTTFAVAQHLRQPTNTSSDASNPVYRQNLVRGKNNADSSSRTLEYDP
jgi:hypothetical protein